MLSISARGSAASALSYYHHLTEGDPTGKKLEDYYAREEQGYYVGNGAQQLGLSGTVTSEEFIELAGGFSALGNAQNAGAENRRSGWDATFSAPKSVSILWATAHPKTREQIEVVHDQSVACALQFIEDHAAFTRRGSGSHASDEERREKIGLVAAAYRHGTSRELDPQLHTHVFIFNTTPRADGTVGALDSKPLYQWKMAAGAAYRAELAHGLRALGFAVERDGTSFNVVGVPRELCNEFSKRRRQIEQALQAHGTSGAKASQIAALETRQTKQRVDREVLLQTWQSVAREIAPAWQPEQCCNPERTQTPQKREATLLDIKAMQGEMTLHNSTVSEAQIYASVGMERQIHGDIADIEHSVAKLKRDAETIKLRSKHNELRYTTREMQQLEAEMTARAVRMSATIGHGVSPDKLQAALNAKPTLTTEQIQAVGHIAKGNDLACVHGMAGTGKSYMLSAAKDVWEAKGYRVRGISLSGKAAQELQNGSGIESKTLKRLEMDTCGFTDEQGQFHRPTDPLTSKDIVVIDEASMVGSRQMAALFEDAERARTKIVLVGDTRQLQSIEAGAAFRAVEERVGSASLNDIRRQHIFEDREAIRNLAAGRAEAALRNLSGRGRVHETGTAREAKEEMGKAIGHDLVQGKLSLGLTGTRQEARDVNEFAREAAHENGLITGEELTICTAHGERNFAVGDRVLFTRNRLDLDVKNGDLGTLREIMGQANLNIELDRGGVRRVDTREYAHLEHGYAVTVHRAQGSTVDYAHVLASDNGMTSREWSYVASSRARAETHIHVDKATLAELAPGWSRSRQKDVTLDYRDAISNEKLIQAQREYTGIGLDR